jgi:amino acid adenylation domain-containing protein
LVLRIRTTGVVIDSFCLENKKQSWHPNENKGIQQLSDLVDFLSHLRSLDAQLTVQDDRLACTAPKGVLNAELTAQLKARKSEIIEFLRTNTPASVSNTPIVPINRDGYMTPSLAQQRLWFLEQFDQDSTAYNIPCALRFRGVLDRDALNRSFQEVIRRHEVLRTRLINVEGAPKGLVRSIADWNLDVRSLLETPVDQREDELKRIASAEARRRFDLPSAILVRACLVVLGAEDHALIVNIHHIAADGWSLGVLTAELTQLYEAFRNGHASPLPDLPIQYADYAHWHRRHVENGIFQSEVSYWKKQLRGPLSVIDLPKDRPRAATMSYRGAIGKQMLDAHVQESIRTFSIAGKTTPFVILLAAFKILLFRYTSQADVIVGSATAGRSRKELEKLIGLFINNLVLRTDLSGDPTGKDVLSRVRDTVLNAFANQNATLDHLVDVLQPHRELNHSPLFQVMFILQNFSGSWPELPGVIIEPLEFDPGTSRYDLTIEATEDKQGRLRLLWQYNTDLFDASTIERMQQNYFQVLQQMMAQPELPISKWQIVSSAERQQLVAPVERSAYPELCIHEWFAQQAARTPDAVAVVCGNERLSYLELQVRTNQLANRLRSMGVGPDVLAALCLQRSVDMLVAVLAVLTAGGAYVPLDPQYPSDRLAFMLADSGAVVLVTEEPLLDVLPQRTLPFICLDRERSSLLTESPLSPATGVLPHHLAYVLYTSGSTGLPKGVEITHRSVVNLLASMRRQFGVGPQDRLLAVTTLSFDIAGLELYLPLVCGAQVILASRETAWNGPALAALLQQSGATIMQATPVTWRLLLDAGWAGSPGLKILCGGEALPLELSNRLLAAGGELWNLYGPTETTIWSTVHRVEARPSAPPIGKPIANTEAYVLDPSRELTPIGVAGELYLGGDGLARGYLGRPELTTQKFVAHPFRPGERLYRTGDLVRWLGDGNLEYLGRLDNQVKLRGYRIELGEIEVVLEQQPGIQQAVVVVHADALGERRLTAYVVARAGSAIDPSVLREALSGKLSDYMVPSAFVGLNALPLTPNKKVDRKALAALPFEIPVSPVSVPPRTDAEQKVAAIWQDLLRSERIGVSDNFFDLGGYSLLVVQLQNRLRRQFQKEISLVELFQHPTVASQALLVIQPESPAVPALSELAVSEN